MPEMPAFLEGNEIGDAVAAARLSTSSAGGGGHPKLVAFIPIPRCTSTIKFERFVESARPALLVSTSEAREAAAERLTAFADSPSLETGDTCIQAIEAYLPQIRALVDAGPHLIVPEGDRICWRSGLVPHGVVAELFQTFRDAVAFDMVMFLSAMYAVMMQKASLFVSELSPVEKPEEQRRPALAAKLDQFPADSSEASAPVELLATPAAHEDALKQAIALVARAGGVIQHAKNYMNEKIMVCAIPSDPSLPRVPEVHPNTQTSYVMIAQMTSQLLSYELAYRRSQGNQALLARVAVQAHIYARETKPTLPQLCGGHLSQHCDGVATLLECVAHAHSAQQLYYDGKYGAAEAVGAATVAGLNLIARSRSSAPNPQLWSLYESRIAMWQLRACRMITDNRLAYMETVPGRGAIPSLHGMTAKPVTAYDAAPPAFTHTDLLQALAALASGK